MSGADFNSENIIRLFRPTDRADVLRIGADTAFFGAPIEKYMEDRRIFSDGFYSYYTDVEPGFCWIAEVNGRGAGFLTGCQDSRTKAGRYIQRTLPGLLKSLMRGQYHFGPLTWDYFRRLVGAGLRSEAPQVDFKIYPAHLHINVDASYRGHGLGRRLMNAYLEQLRSLYVPGVHLMTTSLNEAACRLYESVGFRLVDARSTRMWQGIIDGVVEDRCYGLLLEEQLDNPTRLKTI
jgi:ribosomal protein S18 acetylase RimI-like enzyme